MSCFFCDAVSHLSEYCDIFASDESRREVAHLKGCCRYCLTFLDENILHRCNKINETILRNIDQFDDNLSLQDCHNNEKCYICYTTEHHTAFCPVRLTAPKFCVPKIDDALIFRFLRMLNPCECLSLIFVSTEALKLVSNKAMQIVRYLEMKSLSSNSDKVQWNAKTENFIPAFQMNTVVGHKFNIKKIVSTITNNHFLFNTLVTNNITVIKAKWITIYDSNLSTKEFLFLLTSFVRVLIIQKLKLSSELKFSNVLEKLPLLNSLHIYKANILIENTWIDDLFKCNTVSNIYPTKHFWTLTITILDINFDLNKLVDFMKAKCDNNYYVQIELYITTNVTVIAKDQLINKLKKDFDITDLFYSNHLIIHYTDKTLYDRKINCAITMFSVFALSCYTLVLLNKNNFKKFRNNFGLCVERDFITHISAAISANIHIPIEHLDFTGNNLDDRKGFQQLATVLPKLTHLKTIYFTNCGLSEKCVTAISSGLISGFTMENSGKKLELRALGFAGNSLKDDVSELVNFISLCTSLRVLDLSNTSILIDRLWNNLKLGGLQLEVLKLSGCSTGKKSKEHAAVVKELFGCMVNLKEVDFSNTQIGPEILQGFLSGLANNNQIKDVIVNLNGVCDKTCAPILEKFIPDCPIGTLFLRDSTLENEILPVLTALRKMKSLTMLDIGGSNFYTLKSNKKYASIYTHVLDELVKIMNDSNLQELNLSDARIGETMHIILNALGVSKLSLLDISNNEMGNTGARLLSKALQLNHNLQKLYIDRNQITAEGFAELSNALKALTEHGVEIVEAVDAQNPGQEDYLRKSIKQLIENHLTEMSWATVFMKADRLLTSNNALKLRGSFSNGAIDHSVHVGYSKLNHRPASIIHDSSDAPSRATSVDELNNDGGSGSATPLVHLAKTRPRPAHRLRNIKDENGNTSSGLDSTPPLLSHNTPMNNSTISHMSQSSSSGDSNGSPLNRRAALLPPPASPQLYASVPDETNPSTTTPPPLPRRTPNMPPKLPPKPESPAKSPIHKHNSSLTSAASESSELIDRF